MPCMVFHVLGWVDSVAREQIPFHPFRTTQGCRALTCASADDLAGNRCLGLVKASRECSSHVCSLGRWTESEFGGVDLWDGL